MQDFTLGADPEFYLTNSNGKFVPGYKCSANYSLKNKDQLNIDGDQYYFEVRPKPSKCPMQLVKNIKKCLEDISTLEARNKCNWFANNTYRFSDNEERFTFGGHIHFGINIYNKMDILKVLDVFLGLPIVSIMDSKSVINRVNISHGLYGNLSCFRSYKDKRFEYRMLPTWLSSPALSELTLCLAKTVAFEYLNNKQIANISDKIHESNNLFDYYGSSESELRLYKRITKKYFINNIDKFILFPKYKKQLETIKTMINNNLSFETKLDMKETWDIKPKTFKVKDIWK